MVVSPSQQVVVGFTLVLVSVVVLPRMLGVWSGPAGRETRRFDPRHHAGPTGVRGQAAAAQSAENMQQMKMMMEQEMKSDKYKSSSNKGYVFTLMPLYAVGVGVFAAYKFLKMKAADESQTEKDKVEKGARKSAEAEKQLNELEQRLAQTERMLNSILGQLDPLTNCVKSVAQEQKNEIMTQLQTIRSLMKKRGMDSSSAFPEGSSQGNLDKLIESLAAREAKPTEEAPPTCDELIGEEQAEDFLGAEPELQEEEEQNRGGEVEDMEREGEEEAPPILQEPWERGVENLGAVSEELPVCGELPVCEELAVSLRRRRTRPE